MVSGDWRIQISNRHLILKTTSAQDSETSATINSPSQASHYRLLRFDFHSKPRKPQGGEVSTAFFDYGSSYNLDGGGWGEGALGNGRENVFDAKKMSRPQLIAFMFFGYPFRSFKKLQDSLQT